MVRNTTYPINFYKDLGWGFGIEMEMIYIADFTTGKPFIGFLDGTNTLRVDFSGINTDIMIYGELNFMKIIYIAFKEVLIKNLEFYVDLSVQPPEENKPF